MSLYNAIYGCHPRSKEILALLGLDEDIIDRYRDCRVYPKTRTITILARTGGGNREDYPNAILVNHPNYVEDHDTIDGTYAVYTMSVPESVMTDVLTAMNAGIHFVSDEEPDGKRRKKHNKKRR
jgi:hypothetical protein